MLIKKKYEKESFNIMLNSLYALQDWTSNEMLKDDLKTTLNRINKYSIGIHDEDNCKYDYIEVYHSEQDLENLYYSYSVIDIDILIMKGDFVDYYEQFIDDFTKRYEEYIAKKKKLENEVLKAWREYKSNHAKPIKKECYNLSNLNCNIDKFYEILREANE